MGRALGPPVRGLVLGVAGATFTAGGTPVARSTRPGAQRDVRGSGAQTGHTGHTVRDCSRVYTEVAMPYESVGTPEEAPPDWKQKWPTILLGGHF